MAFLSELIGRPVADLDGKIIGELKDVIAFSGHEMVHPEVVGISVKQKNKEPLFIPYSSVAVLLAPVISLKHELNKIISYDPTESDIFLAEDVFDKQIIDVDDIRVVRVNDIELVRIIESIYASNVDVSALGLLRRMGLGSLAAKIPEIFKTDAAKNMISWDDVELLPSENIVRLRVSGEKITNLHPADLANIISDMNKSQTSQFLDTLSTEQLADALEEVEEDFQVSLVENMAELSSSAPMAEARNFLATRPSNRSQIAPIRSRTTAVAK
jgi:magnesium transporter